MDWVRREKLGHGSFATVSLAVPRSQSNCLAPPLMAVKSCGVSLSSSLQNEKFILEELRDCPEIIRCFGDSFSFENGEKLYNVLLEYASGGSLADKVKNSAGLRLPEFQVRRYTKALLNGLDYIHKFGYVHCDVKLQNILLCADGGVRIADFGLARRSARKSAGSGCEFRGTPMYMSPEMLSGGDHGAPADIWAMGCAVAEMASGAPAWSEFSDMAALMMRIGVGDQVPEIPGNLSDEGRDFLGKCFVKDPSQRWTAEMLLNHPFITSDQDLDGGDYDDCVFTASKDRRENTRATSPRCPFDLTDWVSTCSITPLPSPGYFRESELWSSDDQSISTAVRVRTLDCHRRPNWSVSDDWITIR